MLKDVDDMLRRRCCCGGATNRTLCPKKQLLAIKDEE
jgi:hypothetical protein